LAFEGLCPINNVQLAIEGLFYFQFTPLYGHGSYTPEMNPIEQIWRELRPKGFRNEVFPTLKKVVDRLCKTINNLTNDTVASMTGRDWIKKIYI